MRCRCNGDHAVALQGLAHTFSHMLQHTQVSEDEIVAAMQLIYERMKVVVEPSGAVALAAALSPDLPEALGADTRLRRVGIVLSGGNVDFGARGFWRAWLPQK